MFPTKTFDLLTARRGAILRIIVRDYVEKASPVGSEHIAKIHPMGVSSATIRNEMAVLEEDGFITHPHTSAGRIPSDRGYRYFVEALMEQSDLPGPVRRGVRQQMSAGETEAEHWNELALNLLAQLAHAVALITLPRAPAARFKHLELVALQDFAMLAVLVLQEARIKQQIMRIDEALQQDELSAVANRLNATLNGLTTSQVAQQIPSNSPAVATVEDNVLRLVHRLMEQEEQQRPEAIQLSGLRNLLGQPEFASSDRLANLMELVDDRRTVGALLPKLLEGEDDCRVVIGKENPEEHLQEYSLILAPYGIPGQATGTLGVMGPTRMHYERAIAAVRYLSEVLTDLMMVQQGGAQPEEDDAARRTAAPD